MELRHSFSTIDTISHLNAIKIHLHDTSLSPYQFNQTSEIGFKSLAKPAMTRPEENVLSRLLTNGAGTTITLTTSILIYCYSYLFEIKTMMIQKTLIFACHHGNWHIYGHGIQGNPMMTHAYGFPMTYLLDTPNYHQRGNRDRTPFIKAHKKDCAPKEKEHNPL